MSSSDSSDGEESESRNIRRTKNKLLDKYGSFFLHRDLGSVLGSEKKTLLDRFFLFLNTNNVDVKKDRENLRILEENIAKMKKEFEIFENRRPKLEPNDVPIAHIDLDSSDEEKPSSDEVISLEPIDWRMPRRIHSFERRIFYLLSSKPLRHNPVQQHQRQNHHQPDLPVTDKQAQFVPHLQNGYNLPLTDQQAQFVPHLQNGYNVANVPVMLINVPYVVPGPSSRVDHQHMPPSFGIPDNPRDFPQTNRNIGGDEMKNHLIGPYGGVHSSGSTSYQRRDASRGRRNNNRGNGSHPPKGHSGNWEHNSNRRLNEPRAAANHNQTYRNPRDPRTIQPSQLPSTSNHRLESNSNMNGHSTKSARPVLASTSNGASAGMLNHEQNVFKNNSNMNQGSTGQEPTAPAYSYNNKHRQQMSSSQIVQSIARKRSHSPQPARGHSANKRPNNDKKQLENNKETTEELFVQPPSAQRLEAVPGCEISRNQEVAPIEASNNHNDESNVETEETIAVTEKVSQVNAEAVINDLLLTAPGEPQQGTSAELISPEKIKKEKEVTIAFDNDGFEPAAFQVKEEIKIEDCADGDDTDSNPDRDADTVCNSPEHGNAERLDDLNAEFAERLFARPENTVIKQEVNPEDELMEDVVESNQRMLRVRPTSELMEPSPGSPESYQYNQDHINQDHFNSPLFQALTRSQDSQCYSPKSPRNNDDEDWETPPEEEDEEELIIPPIPNHPPPHLEESADESGTTNVPF